MPSRPLKNSEENFAVCIRWFSVGLGNLVTYRFPPGATKTLEEHFISVGSSTHQIFTNKRRE